MKDVEEITMFKCSDGTTYDTKEDACDHQTKLVLFGELNDLFDRFPRDNRIMVVDAIMTTRKQLLAALTRSEFDVPNPQEGGLKQFFMEMGNKLVTEHGFHPGPQPLDSSMARSVQLYSPSQRRTSVITLFVEFVNSHIEVQQVLKELGFAWPVVKRIGHDNIK